MKSLISWTTWNSAPVRNIGIAVLGLSFLAIHCFIPLTLCVVHAETKVITIVSKEIKPQSSAAFKNKTPVDGLKMNKECVWLKEPFLITKAYKGPVMVDVADEAYLAGPEATDPNGKEVIDPKTGEARRKGWGVDNFLYFVIKKEGKIDRFFCGHNSGCKVMYKGKELRNICAHPIMPNRNPTFNFDPGEVNLANYLYNDGKEAQIEVYPMDFGGQLWVTEIYLIIN